MSRPLVAIAFIAAAIAIVGTILTCTATLIIALLDAPLDRRSDVTLPAHPHGRLIALGRFGNIWHAYG